MNQFSLNPAGQHIFSSQDTSGPESPASRLVGRFSWPFPARGESMEAHNSADSLRHKETGREASHGFVT